MILEQAVSKKKNIYETVKRIIFYYRVYCRKTLKKRMWIKWVLNVVRHNGPRFKINNLNVYIKSEIV